MLSICLLILGLSFAEDNDAPPKKTKSSTVVEQPLAKDPAANEKKVIKESSAVRVPVIVSLNNGIHLSGEAELSTILSWSLGQSISIWIEGAETSSEIPSDSIRAVNSLTKQPASLVQQDNGNSSATNTNRQSDYPTVPRSPQGFAYPNAAPTRYLYAPSSINLEKGQGYVSQKLVFTSIAYAPSDNFTVLFGTFTFFPPALSVFGGKYATKIKDNFSLSAGGEFFMFGFDTNDRIPLAIGYMGATWGDTDQNITVSTGIAKDNQLLSNSGTILPIMVAGQKRLHNRYSFVTENWLFTDFGLRTESGPQIVGGVGSFSVRLLGRRDTVERIRASKSTVDGYPRSTWDFGFVFFAYSEVDSLTDYDTGEIQTGTAREIVLIGPLPWIDYTWHFGPVRK